MERKEEFQDIVDACESRILEIFKREIDETIEKSKGGGINPLEMFMNIAAKLQDFYWELQKNFGNGIVHEGLMCDICEYVGDYEDAAIDYFHRLVDEVSGSANSFYGIMDAAKKLEEYKKRLDDVGASYIYDDFYTCEKSDEQDNQFKK